MSRSRRRRSRWRQRCSTRRIGSGMSGGSAFQSGSFVSVAAMTSDSVSPSNGVRPVSIANRTQPNAQMSVRLSTSCPRACSGLMYRRSAEDDAAPCPVCRDGGRVRDDRDRSAAAFAFAIPKSSTLTVPSGATLMLRGLEIAMDDAASRARRRAHRQSAARSVSASSSGIAPCTRRSASVGPSMSSSTSARECPPCGRSVEAVDGADVRVIQRGEELRFTFEAREAIGVARQTPRARP